MMLSSKPWTAAFTLACLLVELRVRSLASMPFETETTGVLMIGPVGLRATSVPSLRLNRQAVTAVRPKKHWRNWKTAKAVHRLCYRHLARA